MPVVYVVDDDEGTRETLTHALRLAGYDASAAHCGQRGLQLSTRRPPDVLLVDLQLGDMSGLELITELQSRGIRSPVVLMSGFATIPATVEAMRLGAVDFLEKPVSLELILHTVVRALALRTSCDTPEPVHADGYRRWGMAVAAMLDAPTDPKTIAGWSALLSVSPDTLRGWCRTADLRPKTSLDLARVLRAVHQAAQQQTVPERFLDAADVRTLGRLLKRANLARTASITVRDVVARQRFITNQAALTTLLHHLPGGGAPNAPEPQKIQQFLS